MESAITVRAFDALHTLITFADSRPRAWAVAAGAGLVTAGAWWFGLAREIPDPAMLDAASIRPTMVDGIFFVAAVFAPFVAVNALWQAVGRPIDVAASAEDVGPSGRTTFPRGRTAATPVGHFRRHRSAEHFRDLRRDPLKAAACDCRRANGVALSFGCGIRPSS